MEPKTMEALARMERAEHHLELCRLAWGSAVGAEAQECYRIQMEEARRDLNAAKAAWLKSLGVKTMAEELAEVSR